MQQRIQSLDFLRGIAICLVLGHHLCSWYPWSMCPESYGVFHNIAIYFRNGGASGVDLFFVLSGFLISGLLFKEYNFLGYISFKHFFIRRAFKIYPAFYVMMALTYMYIVTQCLDLNVKEILPWIVFLQDYYQPQLKIVEPYWIHTWTLAIEEKFYITFPVLLIYLSRHLTAKKLPFKLLPGICIIICGISFTVRICDKIYPQLILVPWRSEFHANMDTFSMGILIAWCYHYMPATYACLAKRYKYCFLILGIGLCLPIYLFEMVNTQFLYHTLSYLGYGLILLALVGQDFQRSNIAKGIALIGKYSYSIYLWHVPFNSIAMPLLINFIGTLNYYWLIYASAYLFGAIGVGVIASKLIEYPMLNLRDRLIPPRSRIAA